MLAIFLIFAGCANFLNGCALVGKVDPKATWPLNLVAGLFAMVAVCHTVMTSSLGPASPFVAATVSFGGLELLLIAIGSLASLDPRVHGYFCHFAGAAYLLSVLQFIQMGSMTFAFCSAVWAVVSFVVAGLIIYQKSWFRLGGFVVFTMAYATQFLPGYLLITGCKLP